MITEIRPSTIASYPEPPGMTTAIDDALLQLHPDACRARSHLTRAVTLQVIHSGGSSRSTAQLAVDRWLQYSKLPIDTRVPVSMRRFFREGLWLRPSAWHLKQAA